MIVNAMSTDICFMIDFDGSRSGGHYSHNSYLGGYPNAVGHKTAPKRAMHKHNIWDVNHSESRGWQNYCSKETCDRIERTISEVVNATIFPRNCTLEFTSRKIMWFAALVLTDVHACGRVRRKCTNAGTIRSINHGSLIHGSAETCHPIARNISDLTNAGACPITFISLHVSTQYYFLDMIQCSAKFNLRENDSQNSYLGRCLNAGGAEQFPYMTERNYLCMIIHQLKSLGSGIDFERTFPHYKIEHFRPNQRDDISKTIVSCNVLMGSILVDMTDVWTNFAFRDNRKSRRNSSHTWRKRMYVYGCTSVGHSRFCIWFWTKRVTRQNGTFPTQKVRRYVQEPMSHGTFWLDKRLLIVDKINFSRTFIIKFAPLNPRICQEHGNEVACNNRVRILSYNHLVDGLPRTTNSLSTLLRACGFVKNWNAIR